MERSNSHHHQQQHQSPAAENMKDTLGLQTSRGSGLCITVLGARSVGKTALTVQYLTGRFIGDYYSGTDLVYRHEIPHLGGSFTTRVDILDTSHSTDNVTTVEDDEVDNVLNRRPSSAYLVVYSLTDDKSFRQAIRLLEKLPTNCPKFLVANKLDLEYRRQVSRQQGQRVADHFASSLFGEFSAADNTSTALVKSAFRKLIRQSIRASYALPSPQLSSLTKLFGNLRIRRRSTTNSSPIEALIRGRRGGSSSSSTKSSSSSVSSMGSSQSLTLSSRCRTISSSSSDTQNPF